MTTHELQAEQFVALPDRFELAVLAVFGNQSQSSQCDGSQENNALGGVLGLNIGNLNILNNLGACNNFIVD